MQIPATSRRVDCCRLSAQPLAASWGRRVGSCVHFKESTVSFDDFVDLYEVLEVASNSTADQIKEAHRRLIKKYHPDVGGDEARARALNFARDVLVHPVERRKYDELRAAYLEMHRRSTSTINVRSPSAVTSPRAPSVMVELLANDIKGELQSGSWLSALALAFLGHSVDRAIADATASSPVVRSALDALAEWMRTKRVEEEREARRARLEARLTTRPKQVNQRLDSLRAAQRKPTRRKRNRS